MCEGFHLAGVEGVVDHTRGDQVVDERVTDQSRCFDLTLELIRRRRGFGADSESGSLRRSPRLRNGVEEIGDSRVEALLGNRQRFQQTVSAGSQLFDLRSPCLALPRKIAQHPFAHGLGFGDHVATTLTALLADRLRFAASLVEQAVAGSLSLGPRRVGRGERLVADRLRLPLGPFGTFLRREMGGLYHLCGFDAECFGHLVGLELAAGQSVEFRQPTRQFVAFEA